MTKIVEYYSANGDITFLMEETWNGEDPVESKVVGFYYGEPNKENTEYFKDKGVKVKILDMPTTMTDFPAEQAWIGDMITNIMIEVLSSIAQNERETTRQRQLEGLAAMPTDSSTGKKISRRTGKPVGRPPVTYPKKWESVYNDWQEKKITARQAMRLLNLKPNSFYKLAKEYRSE